MPTHPAIIERNRRIAEKRRLKAAAEFVGKARAIHGNKYGYDKVTYVNAHTPVDIFCFKCDDYFPQRPCNHTNLGQGCPNCCYDIVSEKLSKGFKQFVIDAREVHGDKYDYSQVIYVNNRKRIKVICLNCDKPFYPTPKRHITNKTDCPRCCTEKAMKNRGAKVYNQDTFLEYAELVHNNLYDYSKTIYQGSDDPIIVICTKCEKEFYPTPHNHLYNESGCPRCQPKSKAEKLIIDLLDHWNIRCTPEKRFKSCQYKKPLPFDFYIPDYNLLIEYDGEQHFKPNRGYFNRELEEIQLCDQIKTDWADANGYNLRRIDYTQYDQIEELLIKYLQL